METDRKKNSLYHLERSKCPKAYLTLNIFVMNVCCDRSHVIDAYKNMGDDIKVPIALLGSPRYKCRVGKEMIDQS